MATPLYIWRSLNRYKDREQMTSGAFEYIKKVANRMSTIDFSGPKDELGEKLLYALGFNSWDELRDACSSQDDLDFLVNLYQKAGGKLEKYFTEEENGHALKQRAHRAAKKHKIFLKRKSKAATVVKSPFLGPAISRDFR